MQFSQTPLSYAVYRIALALESSSTIEYRAQVDSIYPIYVQRCFWVSNLQHETKTMFEVKYIY